MIIENMKPSVDNKDTTPRILTDTTLSKAVRILRERDQDLFLIYETFGAPPMWARKPGFATLIHIILEQQVSLASARAAFDRLCEATSPLTPSRFLKLSDTRLRKIGFSRQKTRYCRGLANAITHKDLDLNMIALMNDEAARTELMKIKGIGPWTADIYLLMALQRANIWPIGDLALVTAIQKLKDLSERPNSHQFAEFGEQWHPYRAVAARMLWLYYLDGVTD